MQKCNGKVNKILDGEAISLGQVQHKPIRKQWPRVVADSNHSCYDRDQE